VSRVSATEGTRAEWVPRVLQSVERRLASELPAWLVQHRGECRIVARLVMIEQVLIAERKAEYVSQQRLSH
jgi:hypothetical protein